MSKILEKLENHILNEKKEEVIFTPDEELFNRMADFIINIDPDSLTDDQIETVISILDDLEILNDEEESVDEAAKRAKKTVASKKTYGRQWYAKNKIKVKTQKEKMQKSAEGRKRERSKSRLMKGNKTPTGRPIRKYNTQGHTNE